MRGMHPRRQPGIAAHPLDAVRTLLKEPHLLHLGVVCGTEHAEILDQVSRDVLVGRCRSGEVDDFLAQLEPSERPINAADAAISGRVRANQRIECFRTAHPLAPDLEFGRHPATGVHIAQPAEEAVIAHA